KFIPVSKARGKGGKSNPYVNRSCLNEIRNKQRKWSKFKNCMTQENYEMYKTARNKVTTELRRAKYMYEKDLTAKVKNENKLFWSYVRSKTKTKATVSQLITNEGELSKNDQETADILNNFFASVFEIEGDGPLPEFEQRQYETELSDIIITEENIEKLINQLKPSKSQGPDNLHPKFLKETQSVIKKPLEIIFQKSIQEGKLPEVWKEANVTPIFKKGNKNNAENYRPISLTSVPGKILEKLIRNAIVEHMTSNELFSKVQHGFVAGRSCITQLLETMEEITELIDNGYDVDVIYLDFCKAFDKVPHKRLLKKLYNYGIVGKIFNWIEDFLSNRKQRVMINGSKSEWQNITSGIPQGSVLGPVLFLIFINDLPDAINVCIKLFADDGKMYSSVDTEEKRRTLQENITRAEIWVNDWEMFFNKQKCHHLHIGKRNDIGTYTMTGESGPVNIEKVDHEKDLGVIVDKNLKFREHITSKVNIANRNVAIIFRTFTYLDTEMFLNLYKSLVRPHLEYGSQIWSPIYKKDKIIIENVQRRATRLVKSISHMSYENRLRELGLPTLEYRRLRADMVQVYKILNGIDKIDVDKLFTMASHRRTRGHSLKLFKPRARLNTRRQSFSNRIVDTWNLLPETVVRAPSLNSFKSRLNIHWRHHPLKFTAACYRTDYETGYRQAYQDAPTEAEIA
ncbi:MAG: reverse transcriptase family protein, partial [Candidatus Thiodiazotropha sp.]